MKFFRQWIVPGLLLLCVAFASLQLHAQLDQGTVTGIVQDPSGAVIANASVTLTNVDQGSVLKAKTDGAGVYIFSPVKIGNYKVTVSAEGFETTTQTNVHLSIQQRLNVVITLKPGAATETVTVTTEAPLMQTQESSVGQTVSTETINSVPLNGRNWVYIAQLSAGTTVADGSRGGGKGDFQANGQRAEENNFILDGVDNNANVVDFYNGASFVVNPPPDALAEFKVQTSSYSAEFGHSAGAVVNASIKSGTNNLHGSLWEYVRNTAFDIHNWYDNAGSQVAPYHQNQFGATLGGPFFKNKLFFFGDLQATRIAYGEASYYSVPSALERVGDFSELLNTSLTSDGAAHQIYYQTTSAAPVAFLKNCLVTSSSCTSSAGNVPYSATALQVLNYYPTPNANSGKLFNNYYAQRPVKDNTFQWDARMDYTIGAKDSAYSRYSYSNEVGSNAPPLGSILDGGGFGDDGKQKNYGANFMASETHVFTQALTNEVRFAFNYLHTGFQHPNASNEGFAASVGFGGIPTGTLNGGLPAVSLTGLSSFGSPTWSTTDEHENVYQIIDNVTKILGNHALKAGVSFQNIRFSTLQPQQSRGSYNYTGASTANLNSGGSTIANTGSGIADFLFDLQNNGGLSNQVTNGDQRSDNAVYFQDDWRLSPKLTVNLGLRWEYFQPYQDVGGYQASFNPIPGTLKFDATTGTGSGTGQYLIPSETWSYAKGIMTTAFDSSKPNQTYWNVLTGDGITPKEVSDPHLLVAQKTNFAPRVGIAYSPDTKTAIRTGFGMFYGGLESLGYWPNLGENYPFQFTGSFPNTGCNANYCTTDGITIANGFTTILANGFASNVTNLTMRGADPKPKTTYTMDYNLSVERGITNDLVATVSYVGNVSRHLQVNVDANAPLALAHNGADSQPFRPFPNSGGTAYVSSGASSDYNSLQTKIEKRMAHGYNLLATYTWAHARDDGNTPLGSTGDNGQQNYNIVPLKYDYSQSAFDTRQRFTFNALYQLPFGTGRAYLNHSKVLDYLVGGWSANGTFTAQTGNYFTVGTSGISTAAGSSNTRAIKVRDAYSTGGTAAEGSGATCPTSVRNKAHWYNPCSFANPLDASTLTGYVTDTATALQYLGGRRNQIAGPGFHRINGSVFKEFTTFREQRLEFRTDIFNLFNTPALANPSTADVSSNGGLITGSRSLQRYSPDSRFFQMSLKYSF
jgi:hypothetical protein